MTTGAAGLAAEDDQGEHGRGGDRAGLGDVDQFAAHKNGPASAEGAAAAIAAPVRKVPPLLVNLPVVSVRPMREKPKLPLCRLTEPLLPICSLHDSLCRMSTPASSDRTRRQILGWSGAGLALGIAGYLGIPRQAETPVASQPAASKTNPAEKPVELRPQPAAGVLEREAFVPYLNSEFTFQHQRDATAACKLVEVSPATIIQTGQGIFVAFTLLFEAPRTCLNARGTCKVSHPELTGMEFFLTPVGDGRADCGFMGGKDIRTPHIDKLAKEGVVLDAFYVQPVCSPTRAALLTGRYAIHTGVYTIVRPGAKWGLPLTERTLPQALREAGYDISKDTNGPVMRNGR